MSDDRAETVARRAAVVLLAAGRGSRFGGGKLAATLAGRPLVHHAAALFVELPFARRFVVRGPETPALDDFGFEALDLDPPGAPLSRSIAIGVAAARDAGVEAVVVALADMPFVPMSHLRALLAGFDGDRITSSTEDRVLPPAIFGRGRFDELTRLDGDRGAHRLLSAAPRIALSIDDASDVDTAEDFDRARDRLRRSGGSESFT
jgi:molybdenum cofactor cytidylyltransferase